MSCPPALTVDDTANRMKSAVLSDFQPLLCQNDVRVPCAHRAAANVLTDVRTTAQRGSFRSRETSRLERELCASRPVEFHSYISNSSRFANARLERTLSTAASRGERFPPTASAHDALGLGLDQLDLACTNVCRRDGSRKRLTFRRSPPVDQKINIASKRSFHT